MGKELTHSERYIQKMEEFELKKEEFRGKLIKLTSELIDDKDINKTPEMVLAITEASKVCLDGFNPKIGPFRNY